MPVAVTQLKSLPYSLPEKRDNEIIIIVHVIGIMIGHYGSGHSILGQRKSSGKEWRKVRPDRASEG